MKILTLLLALLLTGCATRQLRPMEDVAELHSWPVMDFAVILAFRPAEMETVDAAYITLTDWQIDSLLAYVRKHQHRGRYLDELWDCDDIAREFRLLASEWTLKNFHPTPPAAPAVASVFLKIEGRLDGIGNYGAGGLHVMTAVLRTDGTWFLIEPSNCKRTPLLPVIYEGLIEVHHVDL